MGTTEDHDLLIMLNAKVDAILDTLKQIPALEARVRCVETDIATQKTETKTICNEVEKLRNTNVFTNIIAVVASAVLGIFIK